MCNTNTPPEPKTSRYEAGGWLLTVVEAETLCRAELFADETLARENYKLQTTLPECREAIERGSMEVRLLEIPEIKVIEASASVINILAKGD